MRSGSSILGELFNQRTGVTYLYEPVFPFDERPCERLYEDRIQVLRHISRCEFFPLPALYKKAYNVTNRNDIHARCKIHNVCFTSKTQKVSHFLSRDAGMCHVANRVQICPEPLNATELSCYCKKSLLVAMKAIYVCKLEWIVPLLRDPKVNIKVIHLVRDPRATTNSRTEGKGGIDVAKNAGNIICERLIPNVQFANDVLMKDPTLRHKYMRIRHEDFALDPIGVSAKIYDFVGINFPDSMKSWLRKATSSENKDDLSLKNPQGTNRDSMAVLSRWRESLSFEKVKAVQEICKEVMPKLGYRLFNSENELRNISKLHFTTKNADYIFHAMLCPQF
ncbi:carbohydrate sulfotransferase 1-like [Clavelina lepadiformis]|uniref:carbohydrate sulfotransferase 1-like n=1 Tax=Clavelina lepadiformis TaxID=159417 RepID=UPI004041D50A